MKLSYSDQTRVRRLTLWLAATLIRGVLVALLLLTCARLRRIARQGLGARHANLFDWSRDKGKSRSSLHFASPKTAYSSDKTLICNPRTMRTSCPGRNSGSSVPRRHSSGLRFVMLPRIRAPSGRLPAVPQRITLWLMAKFAALRMAGMRGTLPSE